MESVGTAKKSSARKGLRQSHGLGLTQALTTCTRLPSPNSGGWHGCRLNNAARRNKDSYIVLLLFLFNCASIKKLVLYWVGASILVNADNLMAAGLLWKVISICSYVNTANSGDYAIIATTAATTPRHHRGSRPPKTPLFLIHYN